MSSHDAAAAKPSRSFSVLGVRVHAVQIADVVGEMQRWIQERAGTHYVAFTGMHGVTEAQHDPTFKNVLNIADLDVPDGMSLVWLGRLRGFSLQRRVYGPELMLAFCEQTREKGYRHFFYGSAPGVPERLAEILSRRFPGFHVAGTFSPPVRALTPQEDGEIVERIKTAHPDVVWVGLSTPKQERWMFEHRHRLGVPVLAGVGAAFDLNTGTVKQAPRWMREHGLEWFFRLVVEPRRLWRRYLIHGSEFLFYVLLEVLGIRESH